MRHIDPSPSARLRPRDRAAKRSPRGATTPRRRPSSLFWLVPALGALCLLGRADAALFEDLGGAATVSPTLSGPAAVPARPVPSSPTTTPAVAPVVAAQPSPTVPAAGTATSATAPAPASTDPASTDPAPPAQGKDLPALLKTSEKQLVAIENTLLSLRDEMSRLRSMARHPCDEPSVQRETLLSRVRRDVSSRGLGRIELDTPSVPGGGLAQLRLPISIENGKEMCVLGYWEIGDPLAASARSLEADVAACTAQPALCPELEQYGNAEDSRDEGKTPRTRLRIRVPAHEPWERRSLDAQPKGARVPVWRTIFSSPALLNVVVYERRGDDWRLVSAGRLPAPIRGRFASGLLVLCLVAIFYALLARAVKRGGSDPAIPLEVQVAPGSKPKHGDAMPLLDRLNPLRITANPFGEGSLSNLQFFGFTLLIGSLAFYRWMLTGVLGAFPADLLILLGVSTGGSVAARVVQQRSGISEPARRDLTRRGWFTGSVKWRRPRLNHLLASAGHFDLSRMQAFLFSLVVAAYVLSSGIIDLGTVKIPTEMLSLMGLSQAIYIAGKAVAPAYVAAIEEGVEQLRTLEQQLVDPSLSDAQKKIVRHTFDATVRRVANDFMGLYSIEISAEKQQPWLPLSAHGAPGSPLATVPSVLPTVPPTVAPFSAPSLTPAPSAASSSSPESASSPAGTPSSTSGP